MHQFLTFREFNNELEFNELLQILDDNNIQYETENYRPNSNSYTSTIALPKFIVKIPADKFLEVNNIQRDLASKNIQEVDRSYYLIDFNDTELYEILLKADEWSAFDYELAKKILTERGKQIDKDFIDSLNTSRIKDMMQPEPEQSSKIFWGYFFAIVGGLLGITIGWDLMSTKKTLPNGDRVYIYQQKDRAHGKRIIILGSILLVIYTIYWLIKED
ncbi:MULTISPECIES: hypothetical protein [unclassified Arcicella]|uniref:hypothetical protein n=1 Tax=unclassified Arcicella TaxID=2644986 RepID=UPI00285790E6|nr:MULTISPECIES: hypothetical protein [unclassified Arcicella]MDR6561679.1 putative transcriptional regulator [Arcicella sp. BE51]MDR6812459.1 putative transcriptional regulator [Arcicella sp. BE140]MDR6823769.1 putative transcriptional regulator [Arcicella sp. BE139]